MQYVLSYEGPIHSEIGEMIMSKQTYNWTYGENDCQNYYEVKLGKDYLCIYAHKKYPDIYMGMYIKD